MSLKSQQLTVLRFKDRLIPDDYLKKIVERYPTANGGAFAEDGKLFIIQDTGPVNFETLKKWQDEQKDLAMLMTFTKADRLLQQSDLQPFILLRDAKDQPMVVGSLIGDFTASEDDGAPQRTNIGLGVEDHVQACLAELLDECKGNLKDFWIKLNDKEMSAKFSKDMFMPTKNGWITLLGYDGTVKSLIKGNLEAGKLLDKNWGFSSLDLNRIEEIEKPPEHAKPEEAPAAPAVVDPPKKKRSFGGGPTVQIASTDPIVPTKPAIVPQGVPQPDTAIPPAKEETILLESGFTVEAGKLYFQCPNAPGYTSKAQIRDAYERSGCKKPDNFQQKPKVEVTDPKIIARYESLLQPGHVVEALSAGKYPAQTAGDTEESDEAHMPMISANEKKKLAEILLSRDSMSSALELKDGEDRLPKPDELQAMEGELPSFAESCGLAGGIVDTTKWWYDDWKALLDGGCEVSVIRALMDWRLQAIHMNVRCRQLEARIADLDKPEDKKPAVTPAPAQTKKKRSFGG